ncbi:MAG: tRNA 2-thiouridine(34) synthase MnmA [Hyphomicrobiaceae bacterium]|jgi:tRNA-specific 2-thiouridylase
MPFASGTKGDLDRPALAKGLKRVVVAMSGGVDSSVVAGLLAREGHEVVGITLQLYDHGSATARKGSCCAGQDIHDARRVAETLGIAHYVLDYEERFARSVIDAFAESYMAGETPIPCVTCNQQIKFRDLLETATELGADVLATGHYIEQRAGRHGPELYRAADADRDQSYFLFATTRAQLDRLWFPLGAHRKAAVRDLARDLGLPVAEKADSQDICFVPTGRYADVIERLKPGALLAGDIVHVDGRVVGRHTGIVNFTVGQRKGLGISTGEPLYVVRIDAASGQVVVGPREALETRRLNLRNFNWLGDDQLGPTGATPREVWARVRSSQPPRPALLAVAADGSVHVALADAERGVATGQACVIYDSGEARARMLGGGFIDAVEGRTAVALPARTDKADGMAKTI